MNKKICLLGCQCRKVTPNCSKNYILKYFQLFLKQPSNKVRIWDFPRWICTDRQIRLKMKEITRSQISNSKTNRPFGLLMPVKILEISQISKGSITVFPDFEARVAQRRLAQTAETRRPKINNQMAEPNGRLWPDGRISISYSSYAIYQS